MRELVLYLPGMLRRCPVPTWGRIPISRISWYLKSMRSFCGGRPLPACPRRSGPSPGASLPASSRTFTHRALRETDTNRRMTAWRHWLVRRFAFPPPEGYIRSAVWSVFLSDSVYFYAILVPDTLGNTQPNSTGFCRLSPPKHCLPVDAQKHVNSFKVFVKAQRKHGRVIVGRVACFPQRILWLSAAGKKPALRLPLLLL